MSRGFGEYPVTTGAQATVTGLPEALTTTASSGVAGLIRWLLRGDCGWGERVIG